jgi:hypothetical protein
MLTSFPSNKCRALLAGALVASIPAFAQDANPLARRADANPLSLAEGSWNGANLEKRSNCSNPGRNGFHGTYGEFVVGFDRIAHVMSINETTITSPPLTCTYIGPYIDDRFRPQWTGTVSCSDGKNGNFTMTHILATPNEMNVRVSFKMTGGETCDVDAILGGSRF